MKNWTKWDTLHAAVCGGSGAGLGTAVAASGEGYLISGAASGVGWLIASVIWSLITDK